MNQEKIGKLIAKLRKERKLTQEQLGAKLGVNGKAVSKWECGLTTPDISIVNDLAEILGITTKELLEGRQNFNIYNYVRVKNEVKRIIMKNIAFLVPILILSFLCTLFFMFFVNNYNRYQLINFRSNNDNFFAKGYIAIYPNKQLIILNDLIYHPKEKGTTSELKISQLKVCIINDKEVIFEYDFEKQYSDDGREKFYYISDLLDNFSDVIIENQKGHFLRYNKLKLQIEYKLDSKVIKEEFNLDIIVDETSSKFIS